ncbi:MAG TPA: alcohol dehydrogenase catalytic domain-containing protein [Anaeromyxobacter sp.]|nr:alcohol dehydrogenase catalytic domain-containing protein [Anaeromyxobacter sp.]
MPETMSAVVVRAPMAFAVERIPVPEAPPGGLLVRVLACGLCGSDLRTLRSGHRRVTFPFTIGHEIAAQVVLAGEGYRGPWQAGDRLAVGPLAYCGTCPGCLEGREELCENQREIGQAWPGGFAEYLALPEPVVALGNVQRAPEGLDPVLSTLAEPLSSCINAQEKAEVGMGERVAILGAGPVGCLHAVLARARGAFQVVLVDVDAGRLKLAEPFGADAQVDASTEDPVAAVRRLTGGRGASVVIAATASPQAAVQAVEMARRGGRVVQFGGLPQGESRPGIDLNRIHYQALELIGVTTFAPRHNRRALDLIASGRLPAAQLVTHRFPLARFEEGARLALAGRALKVVFAP